MLVTCQLKIWHALLLLMPNESVNTHHDKACFQVVSIVESLIRLYLRIYWYVINAWCSFLNWSCLVFFVCLRYRRGSRENGARFSITEVANRRPLMRGVREHATPQNGKRFGF